MQLYEMNKIYIQQYFCFTALNLIVIFSASLHKTPIIKLADAIYPFLEKPKTKPDWRVVQILVMK
jgi:hypothetical protein